ncbi:ATP-binding protein, partial [Mycolicibacterium elephantis]
MESDILRHADHLTVPPPAAAPAAEPPAQPQPAVPPLRGRDDELAAIEQAAREALAGRTRLVWIGGEAGAGKSMLVRAAAERLRTTGFDVTVGSCPEIDGAPPGWAWTEILRDLTR